MKILKRIIHFILPGCNLKTLIVSAVHSIWMIAFSLIWMTQVNALDGFEFMSSVLDYRALLEKNILGIEKKTDIADKFLLINSSKSNQLLPLDNDNLANTVITDRRKLAETLFILDSHSSEIKFVIVDIFFDTPSTDTIGDSLLQEAITRLDKKNKIVIPKIYLYETGESIDPIFNCTYGTSQFLSSWMNDQYLKYTCIINDTVKQMPVIAWERSTGKKMEVHDLGFTRYYTMDGKWCLNTMIPEYRYTKDDLIEYETYYQMGYFSEYLIGKDQVVIIGDIEGIYDKHHSMVDIVPGPISMLNAYLAIANGDNVFFWWLILILFAGFLYISYYSFYQHRISNWYVKSKKINKVLDFLRKRINFLVILLVALVSMLFFHFYIHLLILITYFGVIEFILYQIEQFKKRRREKRERALKKAELTGA
jgi:hypothetical protein